MQQGMDHSPTDAGMKIPNKNMDAAAYRMFGLNMAISLIDRPPSSGPA